MRALAFSLLLGLLAVPMYGQASRNCSTTNLIVNCGDIDSLDGVSALTAAAWVRGDASGGNKIIIAKALDGTPASSVFRLFTNSAEAPMFSVEASTTAYTATGDNGTVLDSAVWHCLVGTYDAARTDSVEVEIWLNGALVGQGAGPGGALNSVTTIVSVCNDGDGGGTDYEEPIAHLAVEARAWSPAEIVEYCRGNLAQAQRAAGGTGGGYLPFWDNGADPTPYIGMGVFAGACSAATDPTASAEGPPVFIPSGGG